MELTKKYQELQTKYLLYNKFKKKNITTCIFDLIIILLIF